MAEDRIQRSFGVKALERRQSQVVLHEELLTGAKREPVPAPRSKEEARAQIEKLVKENKASLDALSKL